MKTRENTIIICGSYGYTGSLIARECKKRNLNVILSGRNEEALQAQSRETGFPIEVVEFSDPVALKKLLLKGKLVIHCAGPFQFTAKQVVDICLSTQTHYTDITGEYQVFEMFAEYDARAKAAGITVLPGTGFDVVPTDCLAVYLKKQLPAARHLQLAFAMSKGGLSRGTARTMVEGLGHGSVIRQDGELINIPLGEKVREVDFGGVKAQCLNIPWGDVSTAWHSTSIPHIEVYMGAGSVLIAGAKMSRYVESVLKRRWVKDILLRQIERKITGPREEERNSAKSLLWGNVWDDSGSARTAIIETINGYSLTAKASVLIAEKILGNDLKTGFQTPAMAYGPDFILEIENTVRKDV